MKYLVPRGSGRPEILDIIWVTQTSVTESRKNDLVTFIFAHVSGKRSHEKNAVIKSYSLHGLRYVFGRIIMSFWLTQTLSWGLINL